MTTQKTLRVAMAQLNYKLNDFDGNVALILDALSQTTEADLTVFTELALSGYYPQDLVEEPYFLTKQARALDSVLTASKGVPGYIALGLVTENNGIGKPLHNSFVLIKDGLILMTYSKQLLPTYNIFDERRHFEPGSATQQAVFEINGTKVGFIICEDAWNEEVHDYAVNPVQQAVEQGAQMLVSLNASPSNVGKLAQRHQLIVDIAQKYKMPVFYANQVGGHDQIVFDGGSFVADATGVAEQMPMFLEAVNEFTVGTDGRVYGAYGHFTHPYSEATQSDSEFYYNQILLGTRDYLKKVGITAGVVVGCSGGIDSALTLALAVDALGADRVKAITMPSRFSSAGSVDDSVILCRNLGVELLEHEIGTLYDDYQKGFTGVFGTEAARLTKENVQARIRGTILMEYSNQFGHLLLSTGNKSEISVGYCTLYGDTNGGLNIIGDLFKTEVFALSRYYNEKHGREIIPYAIIDKPPSAELSEGQLDTDSLPPYPVLDEILKLLIEGSRLRPAEYTAAKAFVDNLEETGQGTLVDRIRILIKRSEFKRRQAPPIIRVRNRAFGNGRQIPIAAM